MKRIGSRTPGCLCSVLNSSIPVVWWFLVGRSLDGSSNLQLYTTLVYYLKIEGPVIRVDFRSKYYVYKCDTFICFYEICSTPFILLGNPKRMLKAMGKQRICLMRVGRSSSREIPEYRQSLMEGLSM